MNGALSRRLRSWGRSALVPGGVRAMASGVILPLMPLNPSPRAVLLRLLRIAFKIDRRAARRDPCSGTLAMMWQEFLLAGSLGPRKLALATLYSSRHV
ncbi:hypothetical protein PSHT_02525 [Puccinia striiformis]|uniref:Uncharacterized protein n=1 Tax=Puccinia striiformis TaxID=27350 RepID=A0A2S4WHR5_9BASI|nr:hypothetical protein PSHT_02525 [Puccinia striiformis]